MPYKNKEDRKKYYKKNKDEINKKRRKYNKKPEVKKRKVREFKRWREKNKEKLLIKNREYHKKYREKAKRLVFEHYGNKCACCGESNIKFLSIDHINGGGTKHKKQTYSKNALWIVKNNFPKGFQILCFNCNWGKYNNGGVCPHKDK